MRFQRSRRMNRTVDRATSLNFRQIQAKIRRLMRPLTGTTFLFLLDLEGTTFLFLRDPSIFSSSFVVLVVVGGDWTGENKEQLN